jgi:hypothetical protein
VRRAEELVGTDWRILVGGTVTAGVWLISIGKELPGMVTAASGLVTAMIAYLRAYAPGKPR